MEVLHSLSMAVWQTTDATVMHDHHLIVIFIGIVAIAMAIQAIVVLVGVIGGLGALKKMYEIVHELHLKTTPILTKTEHLLADVGPKISSISTNVEEISQTVREKTEEVGETISQISLTVNEVNLRTRSQISHADRIVTSALDTTEEIKDVVANGIRGPVKQVAGIIAGLRAGLESLLARTGYKGGSGPY
jgi:methyl-accepting chemotaxis protein